MGTRQRAANETAVSLERHDRSVHVDVVDEFFGHVASRTGSQQQKGKKKGKRWKIVGKAPYLSERRRWQAPCRFGSFLSFFSFIFHCYFLFFFLPQDRGDHDAFSMRSVWFSLVDGGTGFPWKSSSCGFSILFFYVVLFFGLCPCCCFCVADRRTGFYRVYWVFFSFLGFSRVK